MIAVAVAGSRGFVVSQRGNFLLGEMTMHPPDTATSQPENRETAPQPRNRETAQPHDRETMQ